MGKKDSHPRQEIAVVGGSAAGFLTAFLLAQRGFPTQVFERAEHLNPAPRTLIVTRHMRDLLGPVSDSAVVNQIHRFELFADGRVATVPLDRPDLVIERAKLIVALAERAQRAGACVVLGRRFVSLKGRHEGLSVVLERSRGGNTEEVRASTVIGADGALSKVAQAAGWPQQQTVPLIQAIVRMPADLPPDTVRIWFVPEDTPYFYWLIPESPTHGVLGVIGEEGQKTRVRLERFLEKRCLEPTEFQAARIPLYTGWVPVQRQLGQGRVYLVGDAASQVKVTTVGGIVTGFRGALGVAEAISNGGTSRELRALRRELDLHLLIRKTLHHFTQADYSRLLDLLNSSPRQPLSIHTRDEASRVLWHLCRNQPRLLLLGLRSLLTSGAFPRRHRT